MYFKKRVSYVFCRYGKGWVTFSMYVCVCVREREREGERRGGLMKDIESGKAGIADHLGLRV